MITGFYSYYSLLCIYSVPFLFLTLLLLLESLYPQESAV